MPSVIFYTKMNSSPLNGLNKISFVLVFICVLSLVECERLRRYASSPSRIQRDGKSTNSRLSNYIFYNGKKNSIIYSMNQIDFNDYKF